MTCDRCGRAKRSVAFRSYDGIGVVLCLACRLALARGDYERFALAAGETSRRDEA